MIPRTQSIAALALAGVLIALVGCRRQESRAAEPRRQPLAGVGLVETPIPGVGTVLLPRGWHFTQGQYPSKYGDQTFHMVRATWHQSDEDLGLLSIDVSPSHPRLWRQALVDHAESRMRALATHGPPEVRDDLVPELPYDAVQYLVDVGDDLRTLFRIFRQKSRVVTVAYTASTEHFEAQKATRLVHEVSDSLRLELDVVTFRAPNLRPTERVNLGGVVSAHVPRGWVLRSHREERIQVPADTLELVPAERDPAEEPPILTLAVVRTSHLGPDIEIEGLVATSDGQSGEASGDGPRATVFEVDDDTLAASRVERVDGEILTITYAAPDYLFDVKPALALLDRIARSARLLSN